MPRDANGLLAAQREQRLHTQRAPHRTQRGQHPVNTSTAITAAKLAGSDAFNPGTKNIDNGRVTRSATGSPMPIPAASSRANSPITIFDTSFGDAPIAIRIPISCVRRATEYASTP